ncbi:MAG: class I tRNA ligase family protein [Bdellovibrionaceae bacterium]|nr:class I tRNA ligase family protein [Pseudobdellovibrionaceae bacterium]
MNIAFMNQTSLNEAYGILCRAVSWPYSKASMMPTFCQVPLNGATTTHSHFEPEIFFITKGDGEITIGPESQIVSMGDLIHIPTNTPHTIKNIGNQALEFLSIYSEDFEIPLLPQQVLITAAPPTPNGPLHLGHISGPYLASDIVSRYLRQHSSDVFSHSGTDDHQNYVSEKSHALKINVDAFQKTQRQRIQRGLENLSIHFDEFIEPKSSHHYQHKVLNFVERTLQSGIIEKEVLTLPHCPDCELTLIDSLADGICPVCHSPSRGGCESCGLVVPPHHLLNTHCGRCGQIADRITEEVYTFNVGQHFPLIENELDRLALPPRLRELVSKVKAHPDYKVLVSHPSNNHLGLKLPGSNQHIHVWFEMAAHYESFAHRDETWIHFFGFDNSFHYLIFIPALLKAMSPKAKLPDVAVVNEFLLLDGLKFSTSRNHAIWADEFSGDADALRLYLCAHRPARQTSNFSTEEFQVFSTLLSKQIRLIQDRFQNVKPHTGKFTSSADQDVQRFIRDMANAMSPRTLDLRQAARRILLFIDHTIHGFGNAADDKHRIQTLANQLTPFMPSTRIL